MDLFKQGMRGPARPAPAVPGFQVNRYSPVSNWDDDPFGTNVFEPMPSCNQKKKPPPRPPPPRLNYPDVPNKPSHFIRKQTVLSSLLSRKKKTPQPTSHNIPKSFPIDFGNDLDPIKMFPKCEPKHVQTASLIDLSSPPSSPTFTTKSSSDGLSVDSFGSDATNHHHTNGGSASQAESGFEDDFDLFLNTRKIPRDDTLDDFNNVDPFSPPALPKPPVVKKPVRNDYMDLLCHEKSKSGVVVPLHQGPTIIRAKPARPKPPDNTAILKSTFGNILTFPTMNLNTTPIRKINFDNDFNTKLLSWDDDSSPDREESPPMPSVPPPPPPAIEDEEQTWPADACMTSSAHSGTCEEAYAIALFDYYTDHDDDLNFSANTRIKLLRRENEEWLYGSDERGAQGLFPSNYVDIKIPLPNDKTNSSNDRAKALYDFEPSQPDDLKLAQGDQIKILYKLNDEWYFGENNGLKGQFPANYVQIY